VAANRQKEKEKKNKVKKERKVIQWTQEYSKNRTQNSRYIGKK